MEIVTLTFPIYQILHHKRSARATHRALAEFDRKKLNPSSLLDDATTITGSLATTTRSVSKRRKMYTMDSLDLCLSNSPHNLQIYASCMELNGENIIFLTKVLAFKQQATALFSKTCSDSNTSFRRARKTMFRVALSIYVTLVNARTASYPINVESHIYNRLDAIFGPATALVAASDDTNSRTSSLKSSNSNPTPWDEPASPTDENPPPLAYPMQAMSHRSSSNPQIAKFPSNESCERIVRLDTPGGEGEGEGGEGGKDVLEGVDVPAEFDEGVFEQAWLSVRYMVWTETWQRFCAWKGKGGVVADEDGGA